MQGTGPWRSTEITSKFNSSFYETYDRGNMKGIQVFNDSHNPYYPWKQQQPTASELYSQTRQYRVLPIFSSVTPSPKHLSVDSAFYKQERHYTCQPSDNFPRECKDVVSSFWMKILGPLQTLANVCDRCLQYCSGHCSGQTGTCSVRGPQHTEMAKF